MTLPKRLFYNLTSDILGAIFSTTKYDNRERHPFANSKNFAPRVSLPLFNVLLTIAKIVQLTFFMELTLTFVWS